MTRKNLKRWPIPGQKAGEQGKEERGKRGAKDGIGKMEDGSKRKKKRE
jgi:hypothetical protein